MRSLTSTAVHGSITGLVLGGLAIGLVSLLQVAPGPIEAAGFATLVDERLAPETPAEPQGGLLAQALAR
jgi:hypothetical protein